MKRSAKNYSSPVELEKQQQRIIPTDAKLVTTLYPFLETTVYYPSIFVLA